MIYNNKAQWAIFIGAYIRIRRVISSSFQLMALVQFKVTHQLRCTGKFFVAYLRSEGIPGPNMTTGVNKIVASSCPDPMGWIVVMTFILSNHDRAQCSFFSKKFPGVENVDTFISELYHFDWHPSTPLFGVDNFLWVDAVNSCWQPFQGRIRRPQGYHGLLLLI